MKKKANQNTSELWDKLWEGSSKSQKEYHYNLPYQIWEKMREILKKWDYGSEYPYSRNEFRTICNELQIENYFFIGSPFISSFNFIFPFSSWINSLTKRFFPNRWLNPEYISKPKGTRLDQYFGYALILCAEKGPAVLQHPFRICW